MGGELDIGDWVGSGGGISVIILRSPQDALLISMLYNNPNVYCTLCFKPNSMQ